MAMSRTDRRKLAYWALVVSTFAAALFSIATLQVGYPWLAAPLFAFVIIVATANAFLRRSWKDLLLGLRLLRAGHYQASKVASEHFLEILRRHPDRRKASWLTSNIYSSDPEVIALNNLGAAEIGLEDYEAARSHLTRAIELDPECPLPYRNMSALLVRTGSASDAPPWLKRATELGLRGDLTDRVARIAQDSMANARRSHSSLAARDLQAEAEARAYVVELINDDVTPMDLVVHGLQEVFGLTWRQAAQLMLQVHENGRAAFSGFDSETAARTKAEELRMIANAKGFSLSCTVRPGNASHGTGSAPS